MNCYYPDGTETGHQQWLRAWRAWADHGYACSIHGPSSPLLQSQYVAEFYNHCHLVARGYGKSPVTAFCRLTISIIDARSITAARRARVSCRPA